MSIYHAPAVRYPTLRPTRLVLGSAVCACIGLGATMAYAYLTHRPNAPLVWQNGILALVWVTCAMLAWQFLKQFKTGWLMWDGFSWRWADVQSAAKHAGLASGAAESDGSGVIRLSFDGQTCLLASLAQVGKSTRWLWLEQKSAPEHWHDLRRAMYANIKRR